MDKLPYSPGTVRSINADSQLEILGLYGAAPPQPEKTLMFAVLLDAVECFQKYSGHEANHLFKDTQRWIFEDDHKWPFSFINICQTVGLNPQHLRKGLAKWTDRTIREVKYPRSQTARKGERKRCVAVGLEVRRKLHRSH
jgi:hypothetical protein